MVVLFSAAIISCQQALGIIHRLTKVVGLTETQKSEIVAEVRKAIPFCPVIIKNDAK
jgi:hypothetical protein